MKLVMPGHSKFHNHRLMFFLIGFSHSLLHSFIVRLASRDKIPEKNEIIYYFYMESKKSPPTSNTNPIDVNEIDQLLAICKIR